MKKVFLFALMALLPYTTFCQTVNKQENSCGFLKDIAFKNGIATLKIKVIYNELAKFDNDIPELYKLEKEGQLIRKNLNSQIGFNIKGCSERLSAPCVSLNPILLNKHPIGKEIIITCKVFERYKYSPDNDMPFFIIIKADAN